MKKDKSISEYLLRCILKLHLTEAEKASLTSGTVQVEEWDKIAGFLVQHGAGPLAFKKTEQIGSSHLPAYAIKVLRTAYYHTLSRGMALYHAFSLVAGALVAADIQVIALKGIFLAEHLYKDIGLRQLSDIDILIKDRDAYRAVEILTKLGYTQAPVTGLAEEIRDEVGEIHLPPLVKDSVSIELHTHLHRKNKHYDLNIGEIIHRAVPVNISGVDVYTLELYDLLIYQCIHLDRHFTAGHISFTGFADLVNLMEAYYAEINCEALASRCKIYRCEQVVFTYFLLCHKYFNATLPAAIIEKYAHLSLHRHEQILKQWLQGSSMKHLAVNYRFGSLFFVKGFRHKMRYLLFMIFPDKQYMHKA